MGRPFYMEFAPAPALAALVRCYWTIRGTTAAGAARTNRVVPDGCLDVIVDIDRGAAITVGAMLHAEVFEHAGRIDMMGVRFVPGAAPVFLDVPAHELTAIVVDARAIWSDAIDLVEQLAVASADQRIAVFDRYLMGKMNTRRRDELTLRAIGAIERAHGMLTVASLRDALSVSERTLQRSFMGSAGLTPKQVLRIMRFRNGARMISTQPRFPLAHVALLTGYTDQAHFTREFRELARITPAAFAREQALVGFVQDERAIDR